MKTKDGRLKGGLFISVILSAMVLPLHPASAQSRPVGGLYQIVSGNYRECCGFSGGLNISLPAASQSYVRLTVNTQGLVSSAAFLGSDAQTVFTLTPCAASGSIPFKLLNGGVFSGSIFFHADPGPPPYAIWWSYAMSFTTNTLVINGTLGTAMSQCVDVPTSFTHSNVVAVLVPPPRIEITGFSTNGASLLVMGTAGRTNVIEASTNLVFWTPVNTNVMPPTLCPICPFIVFRDDASTNLPFRFYRSFEIY